jgi:hypothetical protein
MNYIGNDIYEVQINGVTVTGTAEDFREAYIDIKNYEKAEVHEDIERCPSNYIYEDSARYELLRTEIKDSGFKHLEWNDDVESVLDVAVESAMETAHNWYTGKYYMETKI